MNTRAYIKKKTNDKNCLNFVMLSYPRRKLFFLHVRIEKEKEKIPGLPIKNSRFNISQGGEKKGWLKIRRKNTRIR